MPKTLAKDSQTLCSSNVLRPISAEVTSIERCMLVDGQWKRDQTGFTVFDAANDV